MFMNIKRLCINCENYMIERNDSIEINANEIDMIINKIKEREIDNNK